jgi:hypothetical protein
MSHEARKSIARQTLAFRQMTPGFGAYSLRPAPGFSIDPFLNLDVFRMSEPTFPPHPHAGFSAVTYMLEDSPGAFLNRDSLGDRSRIEPGALHWTQAARGMMHEEIPEVRGVEGRGVQMFVNLRSDHKNAPPRAFHTPASEIVEVRPGAGARVRVLAGSFFGQSAALVGLLTPVTYLDVFLEPGASVELPAPPGHNAFLLALDGGGEAGGAGFDARTALSFGEGGGTVVQATAGASGAHFLYGAGEPLREPVVFGGPFAMTSREELIEAQQRFQRGEMGTLAP